MNPRDNILDNLFSISNEDDDDPIEEIFSDKTFIPKKCSGCKVSIICSILPTFLNLSKIKVVVAIDNCPFYQTRKQICSNATPKSGKT